MENVKCKKLYQFEEKFLGDKQKKNSVQLSDVESQYFQY